MTWLTGYTYRKKITITGQTGAGTNYQVKLQIGNASGGNFNLSGHAQSFPNDIRFTSSNGSTQLDYWIENVAIAPITVWIKVTDSLNSNVDIYCYYSKVNDTTTSNGTNTFEFFDDFIGSSIDTSKWDVKGTNTVSGGLITTTGAVNENEIHSKTTWNSSIIAEFRTAIPGPWGRFGLIDGIHTITSFYTQIGFQSGGSGGGYSTYTDFYKTSMVQYQTAATNTAFHNFKIVWVVGTSASCYYDDSLLTTETIQVPDGTKPLNIYVGDRQSTDWVLIRKYASPEPTFSTIGTEETPPNITATSMTITPSETPCRYGICTVTVNVTWTNNGGSSELFTPNITIDTVAISPDPYPSQELTPSANVTKTFIISGLTIGTHNICPVPN